jgi:hypothetical protein
MNKKTWVTSTLLSERKKKVLFISHDASRTGAPIFLLHFLRWFKANAAISFQIILRNGGEIEPEFEALAPVLVINDLIFNERVLVERVSRFVTNDIEIIYSNTITNGRFLKLFLSFKCPFISQVHELEYYIRYKTGLENFREAQKNKPLFAVSEAVKSNLVENHKTPGNKVDVIHRFIPTQYRLGRQLKGREIHEQLNIPQMALIVGASGTTD